jgi:hypothetical protein
MADVSNVKEESMSGRAVVERYAEALAKNDSELIRQLLHPDYVGRYPQSGEVIRGPANLVAIGEHYPGAAGGNLGTDVREVRGQDDQFITPPIPAWHVIHLAGSGDEFTLTGTIRYPNGEIWHSVILITLRNAKVWRETDYFAPPFEMPEWRAPYVERE